MKGRKFVATTAAVMLLAGSVALADEHGVAWFDGEPLAV